MINLDAHLIEFTAQGQTVQLDVVESELWLEDAQEKAKEPEKYLTLFGNRIEERFKIKLGFGQLFQLASHVRNAYNALKKNLDQELTLASGTDSTPANSPEA